MKRVLLPLALVLAAACAGEPTAVPTGTVADRASHVGMSKPGKDYVSTPAGWYHRSCVHEIPDGALADASGRVTRKDGTTYQIPKCQYPSYPTVPRPTRPGETMIPPANDGWLEWAYTSLPRGNWYQQLTAYWTVPAAPVGSYGSEQVYYSFPGLQSEWFINQPVITYHHDGSYWQMGSWHCDDGHPGGICNHSNLVTIHPGDQMFGSVTATNCEDGLCTWTITTRDLTTGQQTVYTLPSENQDYYWAGGGVVEVHGGLTTCNQYPTNGVFYTGISLTDRYGSTSPNWIDHVTSNLDPFCDFDVSHTVTTVNVYHNPYVPPPPPPLSVSILGPSQVRAGQYCTWFADVTGGQSPYSYQWSGVLSGTGSQVTGAVYNSGWLDLVVTDAASQTDHASLYITVGGGYAALGPQSICPW